MVKVNITPSLLIKLDLLSSQYETEIGGYLIGESKNGELILNDILLPDQIVTHASVTISGRDQVMLLKRYGAEKMKKIVGHWHSHAKMGCFWSGTDANNMNNIMEYKDFFVFIVSSNKNHLCRLCIKKPVTLEFENVPIELKSLTIDMFKSHVKNILAGSTERKMENQRREYPEHKVEIAKKDVFIGDEEENARTVEETLKKFKAESEDDSSGGSYYGW